MAVCAAIPEFTTQSGNFPRPFVQVLPQTLWRTMIQWSLRIYAAFLGHAVYFSADYRRSRINENLSKVLAPVGDLAWRDSYWLDRSAVYRANVAIYRSHFPVVATRHVARYALDRRGHRA